MTTTATKLPAVGSTGLFAFLRGIIGIPVWTEDMDGTARKRRAHPQPDGRYAIRSICDWELGNANGTFSPKSYMVRWTPRATIFSANAEVSGGARKAHADTDAANSRPLH